SGRSSLSAVVAPPHSPHSDLLPLGEETASNGFGMGAEHRANSARGHSKSRETVLPLPGGEGACVAPPIGVCFSGGIDSGSVFLVTYHVMRKLGMSPSRLKAFTLNFGDGPDLQQAREFLDRLGLGLFLEPIEADLATLDVGETIRVLEDYKPLDVECASMGL